MARRAVAIGDAVHAFTGPSGAGKSTLAAALAARGRTFFTDDVLILDPERLDPVPLCFTGQKDLKLWQDAIDLTGAERGAPVRGVHGFEKYFALPRNETEKVAGRLANLVILAEERVRHGPGIEPISGGRAVTQLVSSVYRPRFALAIMGRRALYEGLTKLVGHVRVHSFRRRVDTREFEAGITFIDDWIGANG